MRRRAVLELCDPFDGVNGRPVPLAQDHVDLADDVEPIISSALVGTLAGDDESAVRALARGLAFVVRANGSLRVADLDLYRAETQRRGFDELARSLAAVPPGESVLVVWGELGVAVEVIDLASTVASFGAAQHAMPRGVLGKKVIGGTG